MSLVTRCPKCQSGFAVTGDQLRLHEGLVRCGQCSHVFDGFECLQDKVPTLTQQVDTPPAASDLGLRVEPTRSAIAEPEPAPIPEEAPPPDEEPPAWAPRYPEHPDEPFIAIQEQAWIEPDEVTQAAAPESSSQTIRVMGEARTRGEDPSAMGRHEPEFLENVDEPSVGSWLLWTTLAALLILTLLVQVAVYFRNDLVTALPQTRSVLTLACKPLGCEVEYVRRIDRIAIIGSSLQQSPGSQSGQTRQMTLRLTMQNRSADPQPWPHLLLSLSDASGTIVAKKVIDPQQYLPAPRQNVPFAAREEIGLEIPLEVSGLAVSGFEVQKFFP